VDSDFADFRHSAIRVLVQGLWCGSAGVHADGRQYVAVYAAPGLVGTDSTGGTIYAFLYFHKRSRNMRRGIDRAMLKFPIIGPILVKAAIARFARTLSTMFAAGVPLVGGHAIRGRCDRQYRL